MYLTQLRSQGEILLLPVFEVVLHVGDGVEQRHLDQIGCRAQSSELLLQQSMSPRHCWLLSSPCTRVIQARFRWPCVPTRSCSFLVQLMGWQA